MALCLDAWSIFHNSLIRLFVTHSLLVDENSDFHRHNGPESNGHRFVYAEARRKFADNQASGYGDFFGSPRKKRRPALSKNQRNNFTQSQVVEIRPVFFRGVFFMEDPPRF